MVCLDTDILVGLLRKDKKALDRIKEYEEIGAPLSVTPITACELFKGAYKSGIPENVQTVESLLHSLILLDFNLDSAHNFGRITASLQTKGKPTGELDAIIGAICLSHGEILVTKNTKHFKMIEGLFTQAW